MLKFRRKIWLTLTSRIDELQQKIDEYIQKESDYQEKINNLKYQIIMYQNENE